MKSDPKVAVQTHGPKVTKDEIKPMTPACRSQDYTALLYAFKLLFNKVEATKPAASRDTSAEIFVVCLGYKAPAKIDPCLLDPKHLFKVRTVLACATKLWTKALSLSLATAPHPLDLVRRC